MFALRILLLGLCLLWAGLQAGQAALRLIVLNKAAASAQVLDLEHGTVLATVPTSDGPHEVAVTPDGKLAVISNYGGRRPGHSLTLLQLNPPKPLSTIELGAFQRPHGLWFVSDSLVLVTAESRQALLVVNVVLRKIRRVIFTGQAVSHMVVADPQGRRAYVSNIGSGTVTAIDLAAGRKLGDVPTGAGAEGLALSPDGKELWVANREEETITIVQADSLKPVARLACPGFPIRLKFTPDGQRVLVSLLRRGELALFDAAGRSVVQRIALAPPRAESPPRPIGLLVSPDQRWAVVALSRLNRLARVDLLTGAVSGWVQTGPSPDGMSWIP
ncbi:MAG: gluconolaconase [Calditrichaeota bacterium]|nr:MAG: gluconolaconase [Calditrichota bacterium]